MLHGAQFRVSYKEQGRGQQRYSNQTVAAFLISRPPYAYLGWGWESDDGQWNDIFYLQVGEPLAGGAGLCTEGPAGVFTRAYSAGTASLDCNAWTASLPFPALPHA